MSKFEESLRELVREELEGREPAPSPNNKQIFWLFLCVANTAMLLWLLPETIFNNQRSENLGKFVVWLGGSVFVSSFVWFREKLLGFTQSHLFRWAQVFAFPILTLIYLSQLSIFTIHPIIEPTDAELIVDEQNVSKEEREDLQLSLNEHKIIVQPARWVSQINPKDYPQPRKFKLNRSAVFSAWWNEEQPIWSLVYNVHVNPLGAVDAVVVQRVGSGFDDAFIKDPDPPLSPDELAKPIVAPIAKRDELVYQWHGAPSITLPLRLPHGKYVIFSQKKDCSERFATDVEVPAVKDRTIELKEPCAQSQ